MVQNRPGTTSPSIRVVEADGGGLSWAFSLDGPTWVDLESTDPVWTGYTFRLTYAGATGELQDLHISRTATAASLTARLLQRVPLGDLERTARQCVSDFLETWESLNPPTDARPGPRMYLGAVVEPDSADEAKLQTLAQLSRAYVRLNGAPGWRKALADEFHYSESSIPSKLTQARRFGLLTSLGRGRPGGQLTPKAWDLLAPKQTAWDRATDAQRDAAIERDEMLRRIGGELLTAYRNGAMDGPTYETRYQALVALAYGYSAVAMNPEQDSRTVREAVQYLKSTYPELR